MESIYVLRKRMVGKSSSAGSSANASQREALARNYVNKFVKLIDNLSDQEKITIIRPNLSITAHHSTVLNKLKTIFGWVKLSLHCANCKRRHLVQKHSDKCPVCGGYLTPSSRYKYKGLGHADIEHAYFARYGGASTFYSTDKSFDDLSGDRDFSGLVTFVVLGSK